MTPLDRLRDLLGPTVATSTGFMAHCPHHPDSTPSLSVAEGLDGSAVMFCHGGCPTADVLVDLGLTWSDLYPPRTNGQRADGGLKREVVAFYEYTDANGVVLSRKVRTFPKGFYQQRPDGKGGWVNGVKGVPQVLFNLPGVRQARRDGLPIYLNEGEKDCLAFLEREECATTVPGGAGKWRDSFTEEFKDAWVIIVADRDDAGRAHALQCARAIAPVAESLQVVESDRGKDAYDHFAMGGDFDHFLSVDWWPEVEPEPEAEPATQGSVEYLSTLTVARVDWLWRKWIPLGKATLLDGDPGAGKSTVAIDLAARVSVGAPMPGEEEGGEPAGVIYLTAEDGLADTVLPRLLAAGGDPKKVATIRYVGTRDSEGELHERPLILPTDVGVLAGAVRSTGARLVVVDVLFAYLAGTVNTWRDSDVRVALAPLTNMAEETGCALLMIRHLNKTGTGPAVYRGGGSIGITGAARSVIAAAFDPHDETHQRRVLALVKSNVSVPPTSFAYGIGGDPMWACSRVDWLGTSNVTADELVIWRPGSREGSQTDEAASWLQGVLSDGPMSYQEVMTLARHEGFEPRTIQRAASRAGVAVKRVGVGRDHHSEWRLLPPEDRP